MEKWDKDTGGNSEQAKPRTSEVDIQLEKGPSGAEVLAGLGLLAVGAFAAKKAWDLNFGGVKDKIHSAADELLTGVINKGKGELNRALNLNSDLINEARQTEANPNKLQLKRNSPDYKGVIKQGLSSAGINPDAVRGNINTAKPEEVIPQSIFDLMAERDYRFAQMADIDSSFASEMKQLSEESQGEIMEIIRSLDLETRGVVSAAFVSSELIPPVGEKTETSVEEMTEDQVNTKHKEFSEGPDKDAYNNKVFTNMMQYAEAKGVSLRALSAVDQVQIFRKAISEFENKTPDNTKTAGEENSKKPENVKTDMETMKTEYKKLLLERGAVQKKLLAMMAEVLKANKK